MGKTGAPNENVGIPCLHAPEAPRMKKTWVKKFYDLLFRVAVTIENFLFNIR